MVSTVLADASFCLTVDRVDKGLLGCCREAEGQSCYQGCGVFLAVYVCAAGLEPGRGNASPPMFASPQPAAFAPVAKSLDRPPAAWPDYCVRHSDDCQTHLDQPLTVTLTPELFDKLAAVDLAVNGSVRPLTDWEHWGVEDHWDLAEDGYGDCEDYQLLKRKRLVDAGVPRRTMLITVVHDEDDSGHAVLMIRTNFGDPRQSN